MHRKTPDQCAQDGLHERLAAFGPAAVSDAELVALVLSGTRNTNPELAHKIMSVIGSAHSLPSRRAGELAAIPGMTHARAERLVAAVELGRRASLPPKDHDVLQTSADVALHCSRLATETNEVFLAISLNSRNRVVGEWVVARGWETGVNLTPRMIVTVMVKESVSRVVFVHNHPSGDPTPSPEDIRFTSQILEAARTLNIRVLDHVIVAVDGHASLREAAGDRLEFG
ncbi:MAG: DNA repair protein RadC [Deltaproteobacteria bacterium]|nr:DNA repair protein RadC [Deltaproteobacteria bacterium]